MSRLDRNSSKAMDELFEAIVSLRDMQECRAFFSDLCTIQELRTFSQRLQVAKLLLNGETYDQIHTQVPISSSTITRINTELQFGAGGYRKILERMAPPQNSEQNED